MDELVQIKIRGIVTTSRYGTLVSGDILRTDAAFAKHLVEECKAGEYVHSAANTGRLEAERVEAERLETERLEAERLEAERIAAARDVLQAEIAEMEKMIEAAAKKDKPALAAQLAAKQEELAAL